VSESETVRQRRRSGGLCPVGLVLHMLLARILEAAGRTLRLVSNEIESDDHASYSMSKIGVL